MCTLFSGGDSRAPRAEQPERERSPPGGARVAGSAAPLIPGRAPTVHREARRGQWAVTAVDFGARFLMESQ